MKTGRYDLDICPAEFPWFYDHAWWTNYLDFMAENRFNAVTLWNFHPFPYFVPIPGYEDVSPLAREQVSQNHDQLMWICGEAAEAMGQILTEKNRGCIALSGSIELSLKNNRGAQAPSPVTSSL